MSCIITGTGETPGGTIVAKPTIQPMNVLSGGTWSPVSQYTAVVDGSGAWSITLPVASETDTPSFQYAIDVPWVITLTSGVHWSGTVPNLPTVSLPTLETSHGWGTVIGDYTIGLLTVVNGAPGPQGPAGATGGPGPQGPQGIQGSVGASIYLKTTTGQTLTGTVTFTPGTNISITQSGQSFVLGTTQDVSFRDVTISGTLDVGNLSVGGTAFGTGLVSGIQAAGQTTELSNIVKIAGTNGISVTQDDPSNTLTIHGLPSSSIRTNTDSYMSGNISFLAGPNISLSEDTTANTVTITGLTPPVTNPTGYGYSNNTITLTAPTIDLNGTINSGPLTASGMQLTAPLQDPLYSPTLLQFGGVEVGNRMYAITAYNTQSGETTLSTPSATFSTTTGNQTVQVQIVSEGHIYNIYRTKAGTTTPYYLVTQVSQQPVGQTITYIDNYSDASLTQVYQPTQYQTLAGGPSSLSPFNGTNLTTGGSLVGVNGGFYNYVYVYVDGSGNESSPSRQVQVWTPSGATNSTSLTGITPGPSGIVARKVYRRFYSIYQTSDQNNAEPWQVASIINDNTTTTFVDTGSGVTIGSVGYPLPQPLNLSQFTANTTGGVVPTGTYEYVAVYNDTLSHYSQASAPIQITTTTDTSHITFSLCSNYPSGTTQVLLYRGTVGTTGGPYYLVGNTNHDIYNCSVNDNYTDVNLVHQSLLFPITISISPTVSTLPSLNNSTVSNIDSGYTYNYVATEENNIGHTAYSFGVKSLLTQPGANLIQVSLPASTSGASSRTLWRGQGFNGIWKKVHTFTSLGATTYLDTASESSLTVLAPNDLHLNTTASSIYLDIPLSGTQVAVPNNSGIYMQTGSGTVPLGTYQAVVTYVDENGSETLPSSINSVTVTVSPSYLSIAPPSANVFGAVGWYAYVTDTNGSIFTRQSSTRGMNRYIPFGTSLFITSEPTTYGPNPPTVNSTGQTGALVTPMLAVGDVGTIGHPNFGRNSTGAMIYGNADSLVRAGDYNDPYFFLSFDSNIVNSNNNGSLTSYLDESLTFYHEGHLILNSGMELNDWNWYDDDFNSQSPLPINFNIGNATFNTFDSNNMWPPMIAIGQSEWRNGYSQDSITMTEDGYIISDAVTVTGFEGDGPQFWDRGFKNYYGVENFFNPGSAAFGYDDGMNSGDPYATFKSNNGNYISTPGFIGRAVPQWNYNHTAITGYYRQNAIFGAAQGYYGNGFGDLLHYSLFDYVDVNGTNFLSVDDVVNIDDHGNITLYSPEPKAPTYIGPSIGVPSPDPSTPADPYGTAFRAITGQLGVTIISDAAASGTYLNSGGGNPGNGGNYWYVITYYDTATQKESTPCAAFEVTIDSSVIYPLVAINIPRPNHSISDTYRFYRTVLNGSNTGPFNLIPAANLSTAWSAYLDHCPDSSLDTATTPPAGNSLTPQIRIGNVTLSEGSNGQLAVGGGDTNIPVLKSIAFNGGSKLYNDVNLNINAGKYIEIDQIGATNFTFVGTDHFTEPFGPSTNDAGFLIGSGSFVGGSSGGTLLGLANGAAPNSVPIASVVLRDKPLVWYRMGETSGGTGGMIDYSGNNRHGNYTSGVNPIYLPPPTVAPTVAAVAGTTSLASGAYTVGYTWVNPKGETTVSPTSTVTLTAGEQIQASPPTFPYTVTSVKWYISRTAGDATIAYATSSTTTTPTLITALPSDITILPPTSGTATLAASYDGDGGQVIGGSNNVGGSETYLPHGNAPRSFEIWYKTTGESTFDFLFEYGGRSGPGDPVDGFGVCFDGSVFMPSGSNNPAGFASPSFDSQWHQFVITHDGFTLKEYQDGAFTGSQNVTLNTLVGSFIVLGHSVVFDWWWAGSLDEFSAYDYALTPQQISSHYQATIGIIGTAQNIIDAKMEGSSVAVLDKNGNLTIQGTITAANVLGTSAGLTTLEAVQGGTHQGTTTGNVTLVAGANITFSSTPGVNGAITINAPGVGAGNISITGNLSVSGTSNLTGNVATAGSITGGGGLSISGGPTVLNYQVDGGTPLTVYAKGYNPGHSGGNTFNFLINGVNAFYAEPHDYNELYMHLQGGIAIRTGGPGTSSSPMIDVADGFGTQFYVGSPGYGGPGSPGAVVANGVVMYGNNISNVNNVSANSFSGSSIGIGSFSVDSSGNISAPTSTISTDLTVDRRIYVTAIPSTTVFNAGLLNIGNTNNYSDTRGSYLAIRAPSGTTADAIEYQVNGVEFARLDSAGNLTITGNISAANFAGTTGAAGVTSVVGSAGGSTIVNGGLTFASSSGLSISSSGSTVTFTLAVPAPMANPMTAVGDLVTGGTVTGGVATPVRLAIGAPNQLLSVSGAGGSYVWINNTFMNNPMIQAADLIVGGVGGTPGRLGAGVDGQVLTLSSGTPVWANSASGFANPLTTTGDVLFRSSTAAAARLGIGSTGQVLTVVAGIPAWATSPTGFANPMTTDGDLIIESGGSPSRLALGSTGQFLGITSGLPAWQSLPVNVSSLNSLTGALSVVQGTGISVTQSGSTITIAAQGTTYTTDVARVHNTTNESVPTGTWTSLTFNTVDFDNNSLHSIVTNTSRITVSNGGIYAIVGVVAFDVAGATGLRQARIYKNGTTQLDIATVYNVGSADASTVQVGGQVFQLNANDYVELQGYQNSGNSVNALTPDTTFMVWRVG